MRVPRVVDHLGAIGIIEGSKLLPFPVKRFYFIHSVPPGATRGSHAHLALEQVLIAVSGSVRVRLDDGRASVEFSLSTPDVALYIPPGYWRTLTDFAPVSVIAVLASHEYDESDYIRDYDAFLDWSRRHGE